MEPKYKIGQKVKVRKPKSNSSALRESEIGQYAHQSGIVTNYYSIRPNFSEVFYLYTVNIRSGQKDIVLHEDEIKD